MKKHLIFLLIILIIIANSIITFANNNKFTLELNYDEKTHTYTGEKVDIRLDTQLITGYEMPPIILDGRTLVPLRSVFEKMGATIFWDSSESKVHIAKDENNLVFQIGSNILTKNGTEEIEIDVPAKIINSYTMIPVRAVAQALDCTVSWDNDTKTVDIYQKGFDMSTILKEEAEAATAPNSDAKKDGIKIVWDQISNPNANSLDSKKKPIKGLDVLSPTWFYIENSKGDVADKGDLGYAQWAKSQGYQLWGLVTNQFDAKLTHDALSNKTARTKIINNLINLADKYKLDGINIDFESVSKEDGSHYLQFIKEATLAFKAKGLIVSVDMYVPSPWTEHYQMAEVGKIVDYVMIMAYDEHYSGSKESGSVSSINWADTAMQNAVKLVDKNKLIMGVPFYTRVWSEEKQANGSVKVSSKSLTMKEAYDLLAQNNAKISWLEETGQHYGEYVENNITKKIWLEDEKSIEERMKIAKKYDLKGIAAWKRGHEKDEVWDVINKYYE